MTSPRPIIRFTKEQVLEARRLRMSGMQYKEIAKRIGYRGNPLSVRLVITGHSWRSLGGEVPSNKTGTMAHQLQRTKNIRTAHMNAIKAVREKKAARRSSALLPIGMRVRLTNDRIAMIDHIDRAHGITPDMIGTVVLGLWPESSVFLAVDVHGKVDYWPPSCWEPYDPVEESAKKFQLEIHEMAEAAKRDLGLTAH